MSKGKKAQRPAQDKREKDSNTLKMAGIFLLLVLLLVGISLTIKTIGILSKSSFDGQHRHTFLVTSDKKNSFLVVSYAPDVASASILKVGKLKEKNYIRRYLEIPIDSIISTNDPSQLSMITKDQLLAFLSGAVFRNSQIKMQKTTVIDILRLWWFTNSLSNHAIVTKDIEGNLQDSVIDKISSSLFLDNAISTENISIEIVNGTNVGGLGNRLARQVSNMGGTVVSLTTSDNLVQKSIIVHHGMGSSYTLAKLQKIVGISQKSVVDTALKSKLKTVPKNTLADIIVIIGEDRKSTDGF